MARTITHGAATVLLAASLSLGCIGAGGGDRGAARPAAEPAGEGAAAPDGEGAAERSGERAPTADTAARGADADAPAPDAEPVEAEPIGEGPAPQERPDDPALREEANRVLDDWHRAASEVDQGRYLGHLAPDAVFMGTDRTERWDLAEFSGYVEQYFGQGQGWTYEPSDRYVHLGPGREVAWFDERLTSNSYGDLRGTGVLRWSGDTWQIVHYSMTFTVPNAVARDVVGLIREAGR